MNEPRSFARPHPRLTSEQCRDVRARAWAFVFECHAKKKAAACTQHADGVDGTEIKGDSAYGRSIP